MSDPKHPDMIDFYWSRFGELSFVVVCDGEDRYYRLTPKQGLKALSSLAEAMAELKVVAPDNG